jgi:plasmid stabilization system protein ParE
MRLVLLRQTEEDLKWINHYYNHFLPEGRIPAWGRIHNSIRLIQLNPAIGKPYKALPKRRHVVPKTPFVIYYQAIGDQLQILRIWDTRRNIEHLTLDSPDK